MSDFGHVKATEDGTQIEISLRKLESVVEDARNALPSRTSVRVTFRKEDFERLMRACSDMHHREDRMFLDLLEHAEEEHRRLANEGPG